MFNVDKCKLMHFEKS